MLETNPGKSCVDIYQINNATRGVSRDYWVSTTTDMKLEYGGLIGGWMKIADYDISRGDNCPSGWSKTTANGIAMC